MSKRFTKYSIEYWTKRGLSLDCAIEQVAQFKIDMRKNKKICIEYWTSRGYSNENAIIKVSEIQSIFSNKRKNKFSPCQLQFWQNLNYSLEDSIKKINEVKNKTRTLSIQFWINKGFSENEAIEKIRLLQSNNSKHVKNHKNGRDIETYMSKGFTLEDAKIELKNIQNTNSLSKFIKRYGEIEGVNKYKERNYKWQNTLDSRFSKDIRKTWSSFTYIDCIAKYGKDYADNWLKSRIKKIGKGYSKISIQLFDSLNNILQRPFYYGENEYVLKREKWTYLIDFYDSQTNKAIEFNGTLFHADPRFYNENDIVNPWTKALAKDIWLRDKIRIEHIKTIIGDVLIIWEDDYYRHPEMVIQQCLTFLKNE